MRSPSPWKRLIVCRSSPTEKAEQHDDRHGAPGDAEHRERGPDALGREVGPQLPHGVEQSHRAPASRTVTGRQRPDTR